MITLKLNLNTLKENKMLKKKQQLNIENKLELWWKNNKNIVIDTLLTQNYIH
jgi:hypothetical protein